MKKILIYILPFISFICYSQTYERGGFSNVGTGNSSVVNYTNLSDGIIGNRYFSDSWAMGYIEINDTIKSPQAKIQFDLVNGDLLIGTSQNKSGFVILDNSVTGFSMQLKNGKKYFTKVDKSDFVDGTSIDKRYFLNPFPLMNKKYLLIDYKKVLSSPTAARSGYTSTSLNSRYKKFSKYFILNSNNKFVKVRLKEKDILKALADKKKELKKFIKRNRLNLKKEKDVVKLLTYYHSL